MSDTDSYLLYMFSSESSNVQELESRDEIVWTIS